MDMAEIVDEVSFMLGLPATENIEEIQIEKAVNIAFRELKRYMRTPVDKTVPFSTRIDLEAVGIYTKTILYVQASQPRLGLTMSSIDSGNVFQVAAAVNTYSAIGNTTSVNIDPIMTEMALSQVRNVLGTDFQWKYDSNNNVVYCTHRDPRPSTVTIRYVPDYKDVSEIKSDIWLNYLIRMSEANCKKALGRIRSKYKVDSSNVSLDGEALLSEANAELEAIRQELEGHRNKLVVLN